MSEAVAGTKNWAKYASGFPEDLSDEQREIMTNFIKRLPEAEMNRIKHPHETPESYACRLLRARKFDAEAAFTMFTNTVKWYNEKNVDALKTGTDADVLKTCIPDEMLFYYEHTYVHGKHDKQGRPLWIEKTGSVDVAAMTMLATDDALLDWHIRSICVGQAEEMAAASRAISDKACIINCTTIIDLKGFSRDMFSAATRAYMKRVSEVDQNHFPETMGKLFVVNTPGVFSFVWAVVKGFLDERTRSKIEILGDKKAYLPRLLEFISADQLPTEYGGTYEVPGGLFKKSRSAKQMVSSGKTFVQTFDVVPNTRARVRWFTKPGDLKFSLAFQADGTTHVVKALEARKNSGSELQQDFYEVGDKPGKLVATWDNSAGWRQREVHFRFDYVNAKGQPIGDGSSPVEPTPAPAAGAGAGDGAAAGAGAGTEAGAGAGAGVEAPATEPSS